MANNEELEMDYLLKRLWSNSVEKSTKKSSVPYKKRKERKELDTIKNISLIILSIYAGVTITSGIKNSLNEFNEVINITSELSNPVNHSYHESSNNRDYWWYDIENMAKECLENNSNYSIDTRIYICYSSMNEYHKKEHMDALFHQLSIIINKNPELYSDDIKIIAQYDSFDSYLNAKGITINEYRKMMEDILRAYAKTNTNLNKKLDEYDELSGGSR